MANLQLQTLLPLLLSEDPDAVAVDLETLSASGVTTANDILFPPASLPHAAKALITSLHPRILGFLAAEGSQASALYKDSLPFSASTGNKAIDGLFPNRSLAFLPSEIVEIVGNHGSGRTYLMLQTVLRSLQKEKNAYALWLDTEGKFKAEDAASILLGIEEETQALPSTSLRPEHAGLGSHDHEVETESGTLQKSSSLSALDRLIVSKAFDLQAAIRAIQELRRDGFPASQTEAEPKVEEEVEKDEENRLSETGAAADAKEAVDLNDQCEPAEAAKADADQATEAMGPKGATNPKQPVLEAVEAPQQPPLAAGQSAEPSDRREMHLRFIVIDSLTPLLSKLFSRESAEGHAKMMTFMRLLRSLVTTLPCIVLLSNGLTPAPASSGNNLSVFASEVTQTVKPSLGPSFSYLCDLTLALHKLQDVFPREAEPGRIVETWRNRNGLAKRWAVARSDGVRWLQ